MYNKNYLSKRPFLVVNTKFLPGNGARTEKKGWQERSGWNVVEEVTIVDRITNKHSTYATLIIDILEAKCIKNGFNNATGDEAMAHFMQKYKAQITEAMGVWLEREAHKKAAQDLISHESARESITSQLVQDGKAVVEDLDDPQNEQPAEPTVDQTTE